MTKQAGAAKSARTKKSVDSDVQDPNESLESYLHDGDDEDDDDFGIEGGDTAPAKGTGKSKSKAHTEHEPLIKDVVKCILEEARMVLPGIQTLFGFQLIAVFNQAFEERLTQLDQDLHLVAICFTVVAICLVMGPAAYDRLSRPATFSKHFAKVATWLFRAGLVPFVLSMCLDLYLIAELVLQNRAGALCVALGALTMFALVWFILPRLEIAVEKAEPEYEQKQPAKKRKPRVAGN
jgi:hypothetical protein